VAHTASLCLTSRELDANLDDDQFSKLDELTKMMASKIDSDEEDDNKPVSGDKRTRLSTR
jgi:hypothetical protein